LADLGLYKDAAALYERILEREPQARNHLRLGQYYQKMGRYEEAARHLTQAIDLNPDASAAYLLLANTHRFGTEATDQALIKRFATALERAGNSPTTQLCLNFALGKMHDDLDDYDRAFTYFERGNRLRDADGQRFVPREWLNIAQQIEELESRDIAATGAPAAGPAPLFVMGMLRSGTTLVERILASHPQAIGLGEVPWLSEAVNKLVAETGITYPACLLHLTDAMVATFRQEYLRHWPKQGLDQVRYLVDKNPVNFLYLGFIARIFPEAKLVHCVRDARDASLSIYFQNFANQDNLYAYDLENIAHFHNGYVRMMQHWERILPPGMLHTIAYEQIVQDQESQTRALLTALDLPWDPACLDFHSQPDGISTASVWQARQPLYARSVGRWRQYERHLGPLLNILTPG
jgi:tetratricopeptide (TPR) repeat protein